MAKGYYLTEADLLVLRDMIARERSRQGRTTGRSYYPQEESSAPETYIARVPHAGIPALGIAGTGTAVETATGTGTDATADDVAGSAQCDIYQMVEGSLLDCGFSVTVYNLFTTAIAGDEWLPVVRDKFGSWLATRTSVEVDVFPICQGRLSTSPAPFGGLTIEGSTDSDGSATLYFHRFEGNRVSLWNGSAWELHQIPATPLSIAVPSTNFRFYDVFLYDNNGTLALETVDHIEVTGTITGATAANPCVLTTSTSTTNVNGEAIAISGIVGSLGTDATRGLNGKIFYGANVTANTITLAPSNTTGLTYTSGGTWHRLNGTSTGSGFALTNIDDFLTLGSDNTRLYLGTCLNRLAATPDSKRRRWVANFHNRRLRLCEATKLEDTALSTLNHNPANGWTFANQVMAGQISVLAPKRAADGVLLSNDPDLIKNVFTAINYASDTAGEYLLLGIGAGPQAGSLTGVPTQVGVPETTVPDSTTQIVFARANLRYDNSIAGGVSVANNTGLWLLDPIFIPSSSLATYTLSDLAADAGAGQTRRLQALIFS